MTSGKAVMKGKNKISANFTNGVRRIGGLIPGRKKLEELRREAFYNELMINSSRSMVSVINREYIYEKVNKSFCDNHNRVIDQVVGHHIEEIWGHSNFVNLIRSNVDNCLTGKVVYYQACFDTPSNGKRFYEVVLRPVRNNTDEVTHVLAETFDVTDIKLKEQAVSEIEWEFRNLESNLPIGFFRCDTNGKLLHVNKAFLRILRADREPDLLGRSLREFYSEPALFDLHLNTLVSQNVASFAQVVLTAEGGEKIICRISAFVVNDGSGNAIYIDGAIEDFTREADLEKRLRQSQKIDTIALLAGGIAHDFNTILTTIYGYSELSLEGLDPSSAPYRNIMKIVQALGRARSLTNQILTFSRQVGQERIAVKVSDIIHEAVSFLKPSVPEGVTLVCIIREPDIRVSADPTQLFRVFINLASNALQAMEQSGGRLTVLLDKKEQVRTSSLNTEEKMPEMTALIRFEDNGPGMDEAVAERIFEPFFTTKKQGKGTGLGLSVVYGIISELDGDITVTSKRNAGTTIDVTIPALPADSQTETGQTARAGLMIIPARDNEAKVIAMGLANSGYAVEVADPVSDWRTRAASADMLILIDKSPTLPAYDLVFSLSEAGVTTPALIISDFDIWLAAEKDLSSEIVKANLFKPVSLKEIIYSIDSIIAKPS